MVVLVVVVVVVVVEVEVVEVVEVVVVMLGVGVWPDSWRCWRWLWSGWARMEARCRGLRRFPLCCGRSPSLRHPRLLLGAEAR